MLATFLLSGCAGWPASRDRTDGATYTEQELHEDLAAYAARFASVVAAAAEGIEDLSDSRRVRRSTLVWRLRVIPLAQELAFGTDPQEAYVVSLGLTFAMRNYLTGGDGREIFGEHQPIAVAAARDLEDAALVIGSRFLNEQQMAALVASLEDLALEHPIRGRDFNVEAAQAAVAEIESGSAGLDWVVGIPMSPFRALEGVGTVGAAMLEINRTAAEFAEILDELPRQNRWQIELLLYGIEDRDTVTAGLAAFEQVAASADRVSQAIARLPEDLRVALADSQGALAEVNRTLETAQALMVPVSATVEEIGRISSLLAELQADGNGEEASPGRPFDIREYEATAHEVGTSVGELRGLLADLDEVLASGRLDNVVKTVDEAEDELGELVRRIKLAGVQLLLLFFGLLFVYRFVSSRLGRVA
jgi:hypothetical protein